MLRKVRVKIVGKFGTNTAASKFLEISESRLSRIIHEHVEPTEFERAKLIQTFGRAALERTPLDNADQKPRRGAELTSLK